MYGSIQGAYEQELSVWRLHVKKPRTVRSLVTQRIERVSKELFKKHYAEITALVGDSPGVYALYDNGELYYVGKSIDLKKRVKQHLKDRHLASWTEFSLYLVRNEEHIHEIESLIVRIASPRGNRVIPKGKSRGALLKALEAKVRARQNAERAEMFGRTQKARTPVRATSSSDKLAGLVTRNTRLYRAYKGKDFKATLTPAGKIRFAGKVYSSASAAAHAITGGHVNGWTFWYIEDVNGDWVSLGSLRSG